MTMDIPPPPVTGGNTPDKYTAASPDLSAEQFAQNRVLHIHTSFFKYGTADKSQAAAMVLSCLLLAVAIALSLIGMVAGFGSSHPPWMSTILGWIGNAFLFTAGIAVGSGTNKQKKPDEE